MGYPEAVVAAIIFNSKGEVLLCKSSKWNRKYVVPGGHIELGETMEEALIREVKEETNLDIYDINLIAVKESIREFKTVTRHFILFDFECRTDEMSVILNDEAEDFAWVKISERGQYDLDPYTEAFFDAYMDESCVKRQIIYNA